VIDREFILISKYHLYSRKAADFSLEASVAEVKEYITK
jgi:hypothetical protein